jgi:hypothetical protein
MDLIKELKELISQLGNAGFLHYLLEPLLLWGLLFGVTAWILSLWVIKSRPAQVCSLILSLLPYLHFREKAKSTINPPSAKLFNEQNERRRETQWVYYTLGSLAVLGLFMTGEGKGKTGHFLTLSITLGGIAAIVCSLWLHEKEIALFHRDARKPLRAAATRDRPLENPFKDSLELRRTAGSAPADAAC